MAAKKKASKKAKRTKKVVAKKKSPKKAVKRANAATRRKTTPAIRKRKPAKKMAKRKPVPASRQESPGKKPAARIGVRSSRRTMSNDVHDTQYPGLQDAETFSAGQSGSLQGLSNRERADSESVDELLEEGNSYEAGIISGVERADDSDEREVTTHEVPEDDVPEEYLEEE